MFCLPFLSKSNHLDLDDEISSFDKSPEFLNEKLIETIPEEDTK